MPHRALPLLLLLCTSSIALGQPGDSLRAPVVAYAQAAVGAMGGTFTPFSLAELRGVVDGSRILGQDLGRHQADRMLEGVGSPVVAMDIGLVLGRRVEDGRRRGPELRLGYVFAPMQATTSSWSRTDRAAYDTLTSAMTGVAYPVDSVRTSSVSATYRTSVLAFDAGVLFRTRNPNRVTFFGGIGAMGGMAFNGLVTVDERIDRTLEPASGQGALEYQELVDESRSEQVAQSEGAWYAGYVPLGIDLRLGRKRGFWRMVHLYHELRPMLSFWEVPGIGQRTSVGVQGLFGLRIDTSY